jgi:hypothetical protein
LFSKTGARKRSQLVRAALEGSLSSVAGAPQRRPCPREPLATDRGAVPAPREQAGSGCGPRA